MWLMCVPCCLFPETSMLETIKKVDSCDLDSGRCYVWHLQIHAMFFILHTMLSSDLCPSVSNLGILANSPLEIYRMAHPSYLRLDKILMLEV